MKGCHVNVSDAFNQQGGYCVSFFMDLVSGLELTHSTPYQLPLCVCAFTWCPLQSSGTNLNFPHKSAHSPRGFNCLAPSRAKFKAFWFWLNGRNLSFVKYFPHFERVQSLGEMAYLRVTPPPPHLFFFFFFLFTLLILPFFFCVTF